MLRGSDVIPTVHSGLPHVARGGGGPDAALVGRLRVLRVGVVRPGGLYPCGVAVFHVLAPPGDAGRPYIVGDEACPHLALVGDDGFCVAGGEGFGFGWCGGERGPALHLRIDLA